MTHSEMDDLYELYLLGALEFEQAAEIAEHVDRQCAYCLAQLKDSSRVIELLPGLADIKQPPAELRDRVLAIAAPPLRKSRPQWAAAFALACAASMALAFWGLGQQNKVEELNRQRNELRGALAILSQADTKTVSFGPGQSQTEPQGRVFISRNGGVVFLGNRLPQLAAGKTFEFWLVPAKGTPQPAGLFKTNAQGIAVNVLAKSVNPADYAAVAVSIEPATGSKQPTTTPILIVPLA
jgi:anti-sigma-K factor RskA